jgi:hypothetical protein
LKGSGVRVWVTYARMIPLNATAVQQRFAASCGLEGLTAGLMLDGTPCAEVLAEQMRTVGLAMGSGGVGSEMVDAPMVSSGCIKERHLGSAPKYMQHPCLHVSFMLPTFCNQQHALACNQQDPTPCVSFSLSDFAGDSPSRWYHRSTGSSRDR